MSLGNNKGPADGKSSNYNWQLRMLQIANKCCIPNITEAQRLAMTPTIGKLVYQLDGTEGLYLYKANGGGPGIADWVFVA